MLPEISKEIQEQILKRIMGGVSSCHALYLVLRVSKAHRGRIADYMDSYRLHSEANSDGPGFKDIDRSRWEDMTHHRHIEIRIVRITEWFESIRRTVNGEDDDY